MAVLSLPRQATPVRHPERFPLVQYLGFVLVSEFEEEEIPLIDPLDL